MNNEFNTLWYVVYTKPRWEKKVAESLTKKGMEQYCPLNKVQKQWHDRKKFVEEPLFTSYVFVKINKDQQLHVKATPGIVNFVYWLGKPAIIKNEEIAAIKAFLSEYRTVNLEKLNVRVDDVVKITQGPLIHREGRVVQVNNNSVKIELPSIGYALVAQVSKLHIDKNASVPQSKQYSKIIIDN